MANKTIKITESQLKSVIKQAIQESWLWADKNDMDMGDATAKQEKTPESIIDKWGYNIVSTELKIDTKGDKWKLYYLQKKSPTMKALGNVRVLLTKEFGEIGIPKNSVYYKIDEKGREILMIKQ